MVTAIQVDPHLKPVETRCHVAGAQETTTYSPGIEAESVHSAGAAEQRVY